MSSTAKFTSDELGGAESWVEVNPAPSDRVTPLPFSSGGEEYLRLLREAQRDSTQSSARHSLASSRRDTPRDSPKSPPNSPNTELSTEDDLRGVYINYSCTKNFDFSQRGSMSSRGDSASPSVFRSFTFVDPEPEDYRLPQVFTIGSYTIVRSTDVGVAVRVLLLRTDPVGWLDAELLERGTEWIYDEWSSRPDQAPPKGWKFKHPLGMTKKKTYSIRTAKMGKIGLFSKEILYAMFLSNIVSLLIGTGLGIWLNRRGLMLPRVTIE